MSGLYDADFVLWSEQQADLLRRLARGERVNDVDWPNLIEEVESLGRSEARAVRSLLQNALEHLLKAAAWPQAPSVPKWLAEADAFLDSAGDDYTPGMAARIELPLLYARALKQVGALAYAEGPPGPLPPECPVTLAELLAGDASHLLGRLMISRTGP
jgi:hypothetical protein